MGPGLQAIQRRRLGDADDETRGFPFDVPTIASLEALVLSSSVTMFVGENGSGKSTLLEAVAIETSLPTVGRVAAKRDKTLVAQRSLARELRLVWSHRSHRGFFLRAEDFFGFSKQLREQKAEAERELRRVAQEFADASEYARRLAMGPHYATLGAIQSRYGHDLDAQSHGESFLALLRARLTPGGLFLLDEPEAALSPQSQLAFIAMIKEAVDSGSQFVMATHSPILMAIPGAQIVTFDACPPATVAYDDLEHVNLTRSFLQHPGRYLRHLWPTSDD